MADEPLRIVMAASEAVPFAKTGGLADVVGELPKALAKRGHSVTLILPNYATDASLHWEIESEVLVPLHDGPNDVWVRIIRCRVGIDGFDAWLVDRPDLYNRAGLYVDANQCDYPDNARRFAFLCKAAIAAVAQSGTNVDIFHAHDWQTALIPVYLRTQCSTMSRLRRAATVFTIHNVAFQGRFPATEWSFTNLDDSLFSIDALEYWGDWSTMKGGILYSDQVTTVSPTYAREILEPAFGFGMDGVLRGARNRLSGIVNGIDAQAWNPATDDRLSARYDSTTWREGKRECKKRLLETVGLPFDESRPVMGIVGRMTQQKGYDVIPSITKDLLRTGLQFLVLGSGDRTIEEVMRQWGTIYPDRVWTKVAFDEDLARRIYAASDMFLMPSRFEPCGISQIQAMRYGSIPIVHATGGLVDTVRDATPLALERRAATGFHFRPFTTDGILGAITRALEAYHSPGIWDGIVERAMREVWSWDQSAIRYEEVYRKAVRARRE